MEECETKQVFLDLACLMISIPLYYWGFSVFDKSELQKWVLGIALCVAAILIGKFPQFWALNKLKTKTKVLFENNEQKLKEIKNLENELEKLKKQSTS